MLVSQLIKEKIMEDQEKPLIYLFVLFVLILSFLIPQGITESSPRYILPETITVRVTGKSHCEPHMRYQVEVVDFKEYVKHVLPNEWGHDWHEESLKAGAVAVKMYAWTFIEKRGYVWDCNWNQVYDPSLEFESTNKAVDDTWNWYMIDEGAIVRTYYDDWLDACFGRGHECMSQWDSLEKAEKGMNWQNILLKYYDGYLLSSLGHIYKNNQVIYINGLVR